MPGKGITPANRGRSLRTDATTRALQSQFCFERRLSGMQYREIARQWVAIHGTPMSHDTAHARVMSEIGRMLDEPSVAVLKLEVARLDAMLLALANKVADGHVDAVNAWLKVGERRARLLGLDAPAASVVAVTVTEINAQDLELNEMINEAKARQARPTEEANTE